MPYRPWGITLSGMVFFLGVSTPASAEPAEQLRVATFQCDVTPPLGEPMFAGDALKTVETPLLAKGVVIEAGKTRYVICAIDWCELCNGSHLSMRKKLAEAAGTTASQVAVQTLHQHTAPLIDMDAQRLLAEVGAASLHVDPKFVDEVEQRLAGAVKESLAKLEPFDRIGTGQAKVDRVASCRRVPDASGKIPGRMSFTKDPAVRDLPEGTIDPHLKTITLARGERPLVRLHYYATHPQTKYRDGRATSDLPGDAREELQRKENVFQVYFTGCGGDITVGKYNDGTGEGRKEMAKRLLAGMEAAVAATRYVPAGPVRWRVREVPLPPRTDGEFTLEASRARMKDAKSAAVARTYDGAGRMAFLQRADRPLELSCLQIGNVFVLHLPGEPLIEFQFFAQGLKPGAFVAVAGYGDCGPGYLCPERAFGEGGYEPSASLVRPESEGILKKAITALLANE